MRVVHIITRLIVGGAQENTIATVLALRKRPGVEVILFAGPTTGPEGSLESRVRDVPGLFTLIPSLVRPLNPWKDVVTLVVLSRKLKSIRPDLVHTHSGKAGFVGRLAARLARVPLVIHTIHGPSFGPFQGTLPNAIYLTAERMAGRVTDHFVVVADAMKRLYLDAGIGRPDQYTRIFSGFDLGPFLAARNDIALRRQLGLAADDFVVGKIARLFKLKGHHDLLAIGPDIVKEHPKLKFLFVGDGAWRGRLEREFAEAGLGQHVSFAGLVPPEEVPRYLGVMDVVVHLSRREGLPRALPQALAAGKPVLACDCDGAAEVCIDGQTGFLVRAGDLDCLKSRLLELARNRDLRERFAQNGREMVQRCFSVDRMIDELHQLYLRLLAEKPGGPKPKDQ